MRGPRRPEDLPRLLAALGLSDAVAGEVRAGDGGARGSGPDAQSQVLAGIEFWLPTSESLDAAARPARGEPPGRTGRVVIEGVGHRPHSPAPGGGAIRKPAAGPHPAPLVRAPESLLSSRWSVPVRTAAAVLAVVVLAVVIFGARVLVARASGRPDAAATTASGVGGGLVARVSPTFASGSTGSGPAPAKGGSTASGSAASGPGPAVVVNVVGRVRHPGVYTLRAGQRVADAVAAAGGVVAPSDVSLVNLARLLVDGEQIRIPRPGEAVGPSVGVGGSTGVGGSPGALVDLNTADLAALDGLPGVGPVLAQRIVDWRTAHGRFTAVEELGEVSGIGEKLLGQLRPKVTVS